MNNLETLNEFVIETLKESAKILDISILTEALDSGEWEGNSEHAHYINKLFSALNAVILDVSTNYVLLKAKELISSDENGEIKFISFANRPIEILSVKVNSACTDFIVENSVIKTLANAVAEIEYYFVPSLRNAHHFADKFSGKITPLALSYGVASQYFLRENAFENASMWDRRFKENLKALTRKRGGIYIKQRRWL